MVGPYLHCPSAFLAVINDIVLYFYIYVSRTIQWMDPDEERLFRLRNLTIVGYFYYLILLKLLHVSVVRPSSSKNIFARIYSTNNGSVVFRI
jgi:hypothetical protein